MVWKLTAWRCYGYIVPFVLVYCTATVPFLMSGGYKDDSYTNVFGSGGFHSFTIYARLLVSLLDAFFYLAVLPIFNRAGSA